MKEQKKRERWRRGPKREGGKKRKCRKGPVEGKDGERKTGDGEGRIVEKGKEGVGEQRGGKG